MKDEKPGKDDDGFLARWSRRKEAARRGDAEEPAPQARPAGEAPPAEVPPVESLDFSSDFSVFLRAKVEEGVKRAALKKLFHSPHFNQMDGLDVYIDDYNTFEPLTEDAVRQLAHAREMLFGDETRAAGEADAETGAQAGEPAPAAPTAAAQSPPPPPEDGGEPGETPDPGTQRPA